VVSGFLQVNAFSIDEIVKALDTAIMMKSTEREERLLIAYSYFTAKSTEKWSKAYLIDMKRC
jgi:trehalose-6-phosphate synthase